jgi:hypothetical protein
MSVAGDDVEDARPNLPQHLIASGVDDVQITVASDRETVGGLQRTAGGADSAATMLGWVWSLRCAARASECEVRDQPGRGSDDRHDRDRSALAPLTASRVIDHSPVDRAGLILRASGRLDSHR